jgi:hypothetical protein
MHNSAYGSLWMHRWLPQLLAAILIVTPVYAQVQAPAAPQNPPAATQPASPPAQTPPATPAQPMAPLPIIKNLKLLVLAGNGEMNDLERRVMAPLVVQVLDQNDRPVEGAEVVFRFPLSGPSAAFTGGKSSQSVRSNGTGEAAAVNWMSNNEVGTFEIHVTATYGNEQGETIVKMQNVTRIVEGAKGHAKQSHWYSPTWVKIALVGVAAGAVVGIVLATRGGGKSAATSTNPITITPGSPTVGAPH